MGALVPFAFGDALIRIVEVDGAPWWVASDIAKVLGYRETFDMCRNLDDDEQLPHFVRGFEGKRQVSREMTIISESGLNNAILKSKRAEAKAFRRWVTGEVLPSLNRYGFYQMPGAPVIDPRADELDAMRGRFVSDAAETRREQRIAALAYFDDLVAKGETVTRATQMTAEWAGVSVGSIWGWRCLVRMVPDADRPVALTPQFVGGGRMAECHPAAWETLCRLASRSDMALGTAIKKMRAVADAEGWHPIPCDKTLFRRVMALRELPARKGVGRKACALSYSGTIQ